MATKRGCLPKKIKAFGKTWTKKAKSKTKAAAEKSAASSRKRRKSAMVKKDCSGYSVFTSSRSRVTKGKSLRVSIAKRRKRRVKRARR
jgi:hypothetical protein